MRSTARSALQRYTCYGNRTLDLEYHCDGYNTCDDGDEYHCNSCQGGAFHCGQDCPLSFKCVKPSTVCDGVSEYPFTHEEDGCAPDGPGSMSLLEMAARLQVNSVVRRGRDWQWGDSDGSGLGVVLSPIDLDGWVSVNWTSSGKVHRVRMGNDTKYDLSIVVAEKKDCPADRFACDEGRCIHRDFVCDGLPTCADKTDEMECRWCSPRAFQCAPGGQCLHQKLLCDGINDCPYGRDEENCEERIVPRQKRFLCNAGPSIVPEKLVCDGQMDCIDGEDEAHCERHWWRQHESSGAFAGCQGGALYCKEKRCLNPGLVCDGVYDCADGEDEQDCASAGALKLRGPEAAARMKIGSLVVHSNDSWSSPYSKDMAPGPKGIVRSQVNKLGEVLVFWPTLNKTTKEYMAHTDWDSQIYKFYYDLHVLTKESKEQSCGIAARADGPLVFSETLAPLGTFPWHAGIYLKKGLTYTGICGGSLITSTVVLSAAHCVAKRYNEKEVSPDQLAVALGKFRSGWDDEKKGVHKSDIREISIHHTYKGQPGNYANDIVLLRMEDEILNFGRAISPVCIEDDVGLKVNEPMQIVGWGYGDTLRPELASISLSYVPYESCVTHVRETSSRHLPWITRDKICSIRQKELTFSSREGLARGDSGGGAVVLRGSSWFLVGIVSTSFDNHTVHTFTDVEQFIPWIRQFTARPEELTAATPHSALTELESTMSPIMENIDATTAETSATRAHLQN
ncbi:atrial natriuretic peptide-converting enzyme-like isoform X2 [Frankliniella occidentalis]|uniref:Atrial natriuretic peptide-converting enzyme-like isoform X2 n=1 Tax=Frankliniella occidentalis TaxID=133901 RepID=A0A9C6XDL1_FRAOC|nr:atrial natriuretic peptide-converting enzyme-like isoform X2 [Frankliniella occidentalis]